MLSAPNVPCSVPTLTLEALIVSVRLSKTAETSLVLAGCGLSNHDNVGSIFRNAAAFGADAVFLDETSCDPLYRKAIRVSVGSVLSVPFSRGLGAEALLDGLAQAGFEIWGLSPRGAVPVVDIPRQRQPLGGRLLFGHDAIVQDDHQRRQDHRDDDRRRQDGILLAVEDAAAVKVARPSASVVAVPSTSLFLAIS